MKRIIKFKAYHNESIIQWEKLNSLKYAIEHDEIIVMQYTGLNDVNGVEIYEGDILEHDNSYTSEVVWVNDYSCFGVKYTDGGGICLAIDNENVKVIGNIYINN